MKPVKIYPEDLRVAHWTIVILVAFQFLTGPGMAEAFETGAIRWENEAMLEDLRQVYSIHQKHNPGYSFPYYVPEEN